MDKKQQNLNIIYVRREEVRYRGDINELVLRLFKSDKHYGLLLHNELQKEELDKLLDLFNRDENINWIYVSDSKNEICIFTNNYKEIRKKYTFNDLRKIFSKIFLLPEDEIDVFVYPIYNILNVIEPKYAKDILLNRREKQHWNWGRLGKKEYRRKFTRMRKRILYSNLKR